MAFFFQQDALGVLVALIGGAVMILIVVVVWRESTRKERELAEAREAYHSSLDRLRSDPANPNLRHETLELGRAYANLTRENKGTTLFDEVALSNDIGAACAAAASPVLISTPAAPSAQVTIQDRLRQLDSLRSQAFITDDEYVSRRERILDEV